MKRSAHPGSAGAPRCVARHITGPAVLHGAGDPGHGSAPHGTEGGPDQPPCSKRILIISDAWLPQVNGVVRTLSAVVEHLRRHGDVAEVIEPAHSTPWPCPPIPRSGWPSCAAAA